MSAVKNDIILVGKIAAFSTMIAGVTGERPQVEYFDDHAKITFTENQKSILQAMIEKQMRAKPGAVRIDYNSIFLPPVLKVYGKYAVMLLVIAFLTGRLAGK